MADVKISDDTALLGADVADGDLLPIVDVSAAAGSKNKKITAAEARTALVTPAALAALGVGITSPLDIPNCALWLDASQLSLADDAPVATWPDLSGNGYDATQATANRRPTKKTNADGYAVVRLNDAANPQRMSLTGAGLGLFRNLGACTVVAVFSPQISRTQPLAGVGYIISAAGVDGTVQIVELDWDIVSADYEWQTSVDNTQDRQNYVIGQAGSGITTPAPQVGLIAVCAVCDFEHRKIMGESGDMPWISGTTYSQSAGSTTDADSFAITVGGWLDGGDEHGTTGDIAELVVFQRALNARERRNLLEYLSAKWGTL